MNLRVLHFASGDGWGGAERVIETLVRSTRHHVEVEALLLNHGALEEALHALDVPVAILPETNCSFLALRRAVRRFLAQERFDVIHCHRYKELLLALLCTQPDRSRIVLTVHGLQPFRQLSWRDFVPLWGSLLAARWRGVAFVAVSQELAERLARAPLCARVDLIPNPIPAIGQGEALPDLRARFGWSADRPIVGFFGRLEHVKGPDLFLEIARHGPPQAGWVVVGWGSMGEAMKARSEALGLSDRVGFLGMVPEAAPLLRQLDVLAMTSRHEGTPMALLESAECAVPVVAFDVGGIPKLLEDAPRTWRVEEANVHAFAAALAHVLGDLPAARAAARVWSESIRAHYAQEVVRDRYLALYRSETRTAPSDAEQGASMTTRSRSGN
ncbi:MAG: glycosyltransferase family 4 protein [Myxococcota bacterium]